MATLPEERSKRQENTPEVKNSPKGPTVAEAVSQAPFPIPSPIEEGWAVLEGHRVRYWKGGSGPPLVLLHGMLGYSFSWRYALPILASQSAVYAPDMLGTGFSDRPRELDCGFRASAQRLLRFLDEAGLASVDLLGTSHGGAVVMMAAALAAERVRSLILVAPVNPWSAHGRRLTPFLSRGWVAALVRRFAPAMPTLHDYLLRRLYGDPGRIHPGTLEGYSAPLRLPGALDYGLNIIRTWNHDLDELRSLLPRIAHIPALLLWGSKDKAVSPASSTPLSRQFEDCSVRIFDGVGHLPYEEVPDQFNAAVMEFLRRR